MMLTSLPSQHVIQIKNPIISSPFLGHFRDCHKLRFPEAATEMECVVQGRWRRERKQDWAEGNVKIRSRLIKASAKSRGRYGAHMAGESCSMLGQDSWVFTVLCRIMTLWSMMDLIYNNDPIRLNAAKKLLSPITIITSFRGITHVCGDAAVSKHIALPVV